MSEPAIGTLLSVFFRRCNFFQAALAHIEEKYGTDIDVVSGLFHPASRQLACTRPSQETRTTGLLEASVWGLCVVATIFAAFLIQRYAVMVELGSLLAAFAILGFLLVVHVVYGRWRGSPILSNS